MKKSRPLLFVLISATILFGISSFRSSEFNFKGLESLNEKDELSAITYFERSALYFVPGSHYFKDSILKLSSIAESDSEFSFQAVNAINRIENQIYPATMPNWAKGSQKTETERTDRAGGVGLLRRAAIHLFFFCWIAATIRFFFRGFTFDGRLIVGEAVSGLFLSFLILAIWLLLLAV